MKQYCRYCSFCVCGDAWYCTDQDRVLSEAMVRHENKCQSFDLSPLGDAETGRQYKPRKKRSKTVSGQMQLALLAVLLCIALAGCGHKRQTNIEDGLRWIEVVDKTDGCTIIRHRHTGVCYMLTKTGIIMLVNGDGSPYKLQITSP